MAFKVHVQCIYDPLSIHTIILFTSPFVAQGSAVCSLFMWCDLCVMCFWLPECEHHDTCECRYSCFCRCVSWNMKLIGFKVWKCADKSGVIFFLKWKSFMFVSFSMNKICEQVPSFESIPNAQYVTNRALSLVYSSPPYTKWCFFYPPSSIAHCCSRLAHDSNASWCV